MKTNSTLDQPNKQALITRGIVKRLVQIVLTLLLLAVLLFGAAGRLDWWMAWAYVVLYVGNVGVNALLLLPKDRGLIVERSETKADAKHWDKVLSFGIAIAMLAMLIVAGLQVRFGWLPAIRWPLQIGALVGVVLGQALFSWALISNPFFSRTVRIQTDRGHTVVTGGPYQYVRHPGYVGMILSSLATPVMFGSLWALIPGGIMALLYVVRTAWEDRTLQDELTGYKAYAQRVPYRLLPGVW